MTNDETLALPLRLLDWYREMGVDAAVGTEAIDWLTRAAAKPGADYVIPVRGAAALVTPASPLRPPHTAQAPVVRAERRTAPQPPLPPSRSFASPAPDAAVTAARAQAQTAQSLDDLARLLADFDGCGLKATAKNLCFYRGAAKARLLIVGEAPGREEDLAGTPFVGPPGQLLDRMLSAIGLTDADCHITNIVYWRPPGNRTPTPQETDVCRPFLERQAALVAPDILLLLGDVATRHVLGIDDSIMRARGKWRDLVFGGHAVRAMATLHPTYLLRTPGAKQHVWRDLLAIKAALAR